MEFIIRKAEERDLPVLVELCQKHAEYEQAAYYLPEKKELLQKAIFSASPKLYCYVVESSKELAGYFSYTFDFSTWDACLFLYLDCLYLEPEFRGYGIGEKIFEKLREIAKGNNCVNIQWQTPVFNERAIKFYKRMGGDAKNKMRFSLPL